MTTIAPNPRPATFAWESTRSVSLDLMMRSEPVRRLTASERAARLASLGLQPAAPRGRRAV
ncbi:MAG: hypothetical protein HOZ81_13430 [Streptomyces sp.]|nr:hypothetical protein [Streptomyces sp.]